MRLAILLLCASPALAADRTIRFSAPMYFLPPVQSLVITKAGGPGPGQPKHEAIATVAAFKDEAKLPGDGPFDVWLVPQDGKPVPVLTGFKPKDGANEVKLNDHLGVISVRGVGQPRGTLLVTASDDPG